MIALHFIVLTLLFTTLFCIVAETVLCSGDSFGYTVVHIVLHCIVFLMLQPCVVHGYIRTQNHEVVLHFTNGESPLHVAILVSILVSIVILLYWCMDISGLKIRGVVLHRSVAALPQAWHSLDPQFITLEDWTTIPTNSPRYPQILELLRSVDSTQMP